MFRLRVFINCVPKVYPDLSPKQMEILAPINAGEPVGVPPEPQPICSASSTMIPSGPRT
jgi:hypothetical protein